MLYFEKYEGTGNDFIIVNEYDEPTNNWQQLAQQICHRKFGIGADGLIVVSHSTIGDIKMNFYNQDGSIAPMCGNGIRCFTKYVYDQGIVNKPSFLVETLAGMIPVTVTQFRNEKTSNVRVGLGTPIFLTEQLNLNTSQPIIINEKITIEGKTLHYSVLFLGTLHTVLLVSNLDQIPIEHYGQYIQQLSLFPNQTNVNFVEILSDHQMKVKTYERGAGLTLSCGTGVSASALIGMMLAGMNPMVQVETLGGNLLVEKEQGQIYLSGPATFIAKGHYMKGE